MSIFSRLVECPPLPYRLLFPEAIWRLKRRGRKVAYLTFDDGPIPEVTPWVLDVLDRYDVKATFFWVGDNARRYPDLVQEVISRGHSYGNHTMHHLQGMKVTGITYLRDVREADAYIDSTLFRPPHGIMRWGQANAIKKKFNIIMYDVVTRDYNKSVSPERVLNNVKRYTRSGSVIVFHDSMKAWKNMHAALPKAIEWLKSEGYELLPLDM